MAAPAVMIGPWGGRGGTPRDIRKGNGNRPHHLESITIRSSESYGGRINGFSFVYVDQKGQSIPSGVWGSATKGYEDTITLGDGEFLTFISGTTDAGGVTSLTFVTNTGVEYGPYGNPSGGTPFSVPLQQGKGEVLAFFGRGGDCLVALGVYVTTRNPYA